MNRHPELGEDILTSVPGLEKVTAWASQHHERLDGLGYPHGLAGQALSLGSRIMSLADVFTALREDRPYRAGLANGETLAILDGMSAQGVLDPDLLALARKNLDELDIRRRAAQAKAASEFRQFYSDVTAQ